MIKLLKRYLFCEKHKGKKYFTGGLLPHVEDERDFRYEQLGGIFGYEPKHDEYEIDTLSVKDQNGFNTCSWNAYTVSCEVDEKKVLSVKSIVCYARQKAYLSGNGFASLRGNQQVGIEFGVAEEDLIPDVKTPWEDYSRPSNLTQEVRDNASTHKSKSYFTVRSRNEWLKALDDGRIIETGFTWFSAYNTTSGLKAPWILPWGKGTAIGGHGVVCKGYSIKKGLLKFQNSFGENWADKGCFYVDMNNWFNQGIVGYVRVDLTDEQLIGFIKQYEGKDVKGSTPAIYHIENGMKRGYPDDVTFAAFGGRTGANKTYSSVAQQLLDQVPEGDKMNITASPFWPILKENWDTISKLQNPKNFIMVQDLVNSLKVSQPQTLWARLSNLI